MDALFNFIGSIFGYVLNFFNVIFGNFGVSIIFFTLFTRILLFPLTIKQQKSMAGMQRLQPKMKELQEKYGDNKAKYNEEVSKLYQKEGQSPAGGCLPMLIQLPIFYGLYRAICMPLTCTLHLQITGDGTLASAIERIRTLGDVYTSPGSTFYSQLSIIEAVRKINENYAAYGFTQAQGEALKPILDLSRQFNFFGIDLLQIAAFWNPAIIFTFVVFFASAGGMFLTNKLTSSGAQAQMNGCSPNMMGIMMGAFSAWISFSVPCAMALYWSCSSLFAPAQSWIVNKYYNAAILNSRSEAQRMAKIRLEEESVINSVYNKKGVKKFSPIYSLPPSANAATQAGTTVDGDVGKNPVSQEKPKQTQTASVKKQGQSKKKKNSSGKGKQASSNYQGKKKK